MMKSEARSAALAAINAIFTSMGELDEALTILLEHGMDEFEARDCGNEIITAEVSMGRVFDWIQKIGK